MKQRTIYRTDDELKEEIMRYVEMRSERGAKRGLRYPAIRTAGMVEALGYSRMTNRLRRVVEELCEDKKLVRVDTYYPGAAGVRHAYYLPKYVPVHMGMAGL